MSRLIPDHGRGGPLLTDEEEQVRGEDSASRVDSVLLASSARANVGQRKLVGRDKVVV